LFTNISASNTILQVTYVVHKIFHANVQYSNASFTLKFVVKKSSLVDWFEYD